MVYKTLHTYIIRELLRIFLMTASALTTLLAFGGTFKPFTKQGLDVGQLMLIMFDLMPAMLAYAIPIAALFAAVLVYWRMSTDNELTACRAGGISFLTIAAPALMLGLAVASVDMVFVNWVVPRYLQKTERAIMKDLGTLIVSQVEHKETIDYGNWVIYADSADLEQIDEQTSRITLHGAALSESEKGLTQIVAVAPEATIVIRNIPEVDGSEMTIHVTQGSAFAPQKGFLRIQASGDSSMLLDHPIFVPSLLKSKPKFLNLKELFKLNQDPTLFPPVLEIIRKVENLKEYQQVSGRVFDLWTRQAGAPLSLMQTSIGVGSGPGGGSAANELRLYATDARIDPNATPDHALSFFMKPPLLPKGPQVRIDQYDAQGKLDTTYTCDHVDTELLIDEITGTGMSLALQLSGNVKSHDHVHNVTQSRDDFALAGVIVPLEARAPHVDPGEIEPASDGEKYRRELQEFARTNPMSGMQKLSADAQLNVQKLFQNIDSELHSRGSFALSCLTLVLFGAALGILLRGKNPLAVFVLGFVPAVFLVLLITAGREIAEGNPAHAATGLALIWAGNGVLLALVIGVYAKLLRH